MRMAGLVYMIFFIQCSAWGKEALSSSAYATVNAGFVSKNIAFIENKGQITDQHGTSRPDIQYKIAVPGLSIFIGNGQVHYQFFKTHHSPLTPENQQIALLPPGNQDTEMDTLYRMDMTLTGANKKAAIIAEQKNGYTENYFKDQSAEGTKANTYSKITYKNIYPDIDWVLYIKDNSFKYDFVVRPGGDVRNIQLAYQGATRLSLEDDGNFKAVTPLGDIVEQKPFSYEAGSMRPVASSFSLAGNMLSFRTEPCAGALVIDPKLSWATYYGGGNDENGYGITSDTAGNIYIAGLCNSSSNIATTGAYQTTYGGDIDAYIAKFTSTGSRLWASYYGGTYGEQASAVVCDISGNVYIAGFTYSLTGIATPSAYKTSNGGKGDAFLAKFSTTGSRIWGTYFGDTGVDQALGIVCDPSGNVYMVGQTSSTSGIVTSGSYQTTFGGAYDAFLAKFTSGGALDWATYMGGTGNDQLHGITMDPSGNLCVTGFSSSTLGIATFGSYQSSNAGGNDVVIAKFYTSGALQWATYFGGGSGDVGEAIATDASGNIYVTGETQSSGIATAGSFQSSYGGAYDAFLVKFNASGSRIWATYFGGSSYDGGLGVACDGFSNVFITGSTISYFGIAGSASYQTSLGGSYDAFFAKFSSAGANLYSSYFGGTNTDYGNGIICDKYNATYITGSTQSTSGIATPGAYQTSNGGGNDAFILKLAADTFMYFRQPYVSTAMCAGFSFYVPYGVSTPYRNGNTFTVQLSDAAGSFASAVNIGSKTTPYTDSILCTLPTGISGSGYKIRLLASGPADTITYTNSIQISYLATPTITANTPVCPGDTIKFRGDNAIAADYEWYGPNNFRASTQATVIPSASALNAGTYQLVAWLGPCHLSATATIVVKTAPVDSIVYSNSVCTGDTIKIITYSTAASVFNWTGPNNLTASTQSIALPNAATANAGKYYLSATFNGCTLKDTAIIAIKPLPAKPIAANDGPVCIGMPLNLYSSSSTTGISYQWSGPHSFSSNLQNVTINPAASADSGKYVIAVTKNGCTTRDTTNVAVKPLPPHLVVTGSTTICSGDSTKLISGSYPAGTTFTWSGPVGYSATNKNLLIGNTAISQAGNYYLATSLNGCMVYDTVMLTVKQTPAILSASGNSPVCLNTPLNLKAIADTGVTYSWTGPSSFTSTLQNPVKSSVSFSDSGNYIFTATLNGCKSKSDTVHVAVNPILANLKTSGNISVCEGDTLLISATSTSTGVLYAWSGPGAFTSNNQNVVLTNVNSSQAGLYTVVASLNGCTAGESLTVTVKPLPILTSVGNNGPVCEGSRLTLTATSATPGATFKWSGPNSFSSTAQNPFITAPSVSNSGTYSVSAILNGCQATNTTKVLVNQLPQLPTAGSNSPVCAGQPLNFTAGSASTGITYVWQGPAGFSSLQQNPVINSAQVTGSGTYSVIISLGNCADTITVPVVINPAVGPASLIITAAPGDTICVGNPCTFKAQPTNGGTSPAYQWKKNGTAISGAIAGTYTATSVTDGDTYSCTMVSNAPCQLVTSAISNNVTLHTLNIRTAPIVTVISSGTNPVTYTANIIGNSQGLTYQWKKNGSNVAGATGSTYTTNTVAGDKISVVVRSKAPCMMPDSVVSQIKVGIENLDGQAKNISIYPNPGNGAVTIERTNTNGYYPVNINDVSGKRVAAYYLLFSNNKAALKLDVPPGIYLLELIPPSGERDIAKLVIY